MNWVQLAYLATGVLVGGVGTYIVMCLMVAPRG